MGTLRVQACCADEEDYIDMEVSSSDSSNFLCYSSNITSPPPPQTKEFEFQLISSSSSSIPQDKDKEATTSSPADELFYKGKLLPLHLPPRLQMVRKLLLNSEEQHQPFPFEDKYSAIPFVNTSESCRVSCEIEPDEYLFEWSSAEMSASINAHHDHNQLPIKKKSSWTKKLKQIKQYSVLSQKLKASRAYLKSLFIKPAGYSNEFSAQDNQDCSNKCMKVQERNPVGKYDNIKLVSSSIDREIVEDGNTAIQRRSFSGAIQWHSSTSTKSSTSSSSSSSATSSGSSSFSFSSNGIYDAQLLKRSTSANSEIESSIEGAIAHCKR